MDTNEYYTDLHEVDYLLQIMELAWRENGLDQYGAQRSNPPTRIAENQK